jgi:hypothetical protein
MQLSPWPLIWTLTISAAPPAVAQTAAHAHVVQLNQGWSDREIEFYNHATEGTNLAPLDFVLNLPDPAKPGSHFIDKVAAEYGFIPAQKSALNPYGLPVGFAIDDRPKAFGDRVYLGITCSACHTRQLTYSHTILPVHGGPALVDMQRFKNDFYDAFFILLNNDRAAHDFAQGVLQKAPSNEDITTLRKEIEEFTGPVKVGRSLTPADTIPPADFGPGNLNALSQGNYNNFALSGWLTMKGLLPKSSEVPARPRMEGAANYPPMWFAPFDTWAQWFVEIHDPGPRNWVQSVSTSEVRPPKMIAVRGPASVLESIHFENIAEIQHSLELLRTPKWPEAVFGAIDQIKAEEGRVIYEEQCARCHTRKVLPPNSLGIVFKDRPAFDVGTDPTAYAQFAQDAAQRAAGLQKLADMIVAMRKQQLDQQVGATLELNFMNLYSRGRPNEFKLATDNYAGAADATWAKSGAAYWASPLEGIFASSPYLHNGSVRTLWDLLTPPEQRPASFRTGSTEFDAKGIGLRSEGRFLYNTKDQGKGNGGHIFGTDLPREKKAALVEYLKSI